MLSSVRKMAAMANQEAQHNQYDKLSTLPKYQIGDWVFVYFPSDETGKMCRMSQPWHDPYRIISKDDPDVTVTKSIFQMTPLYKFIK